MDKIKELKKIILNNKHFSMSLVELCDNINVNYECFRKTFRNNEGVELSKYFQEAKMNYVEYCLLETNYKIYKIALEVGYKYEQHFIRWFKNIKTITPHQYRLMVTDNGNRQW